MKKKFLLTIFIVLILLAGFFCTEDKHLNNKQDIKQLSGLWINDNGLYYLNMPENEPISFVLPNTSATLSKNAVATLTANALQFKDGKASFSIPINDMPPRFGKNKCLEADNTRLCLAKR